MAAPLSRTGRRRSAQASSYKGQRQRTLSLRRAVWCSLENRPIPVSRVGAAQAISSATGHCPPTERRSLPASVFRVSRLIGRQPRLIYSRVSGLVRHFSAAIEKR